MVVLKFPKNFLWGSATSAYQVEGGIENCDWAQRQPAGKAADHYNLYEKDFQLLQKLGQNVHRLSLEWSRIEPQEGVFDEEEIEHYRKVLQSLHKKGFATMVTLHHLTTPVWLAEQGGWASGKSVERFLRYAELVFHAYRELVDFWIPINEPTNYAFFGCIAGKWAPFKRNPLTFIRVTRNQIQAHKAVYELFHEEDALVKVGVAKSYAFKEPFSQTVPLKWADEGMVGLHKYFFNDFFLEKTKQHLDFIGVNYYFHEKIRFPFPYPKTGGDVVSDVGWEIYPEGLYRVLKEVDEKYHLPIYITENGLADAKDAQRAEFIRYHLKWMHKAIGEGVPVKGYFYWSSMDNFEWEKGFEPRFGLVAVDYETQKRTPRPSAEYYAEICKTNELQL